MIALDTLLKKAQLKLQGVHPAIAEKALQLVTKAHAEKIYIIISQGFRSIAEQDALYAQGRTTPGKIVTNAKGGQSYHNYGLAFDFAVLDNISTVNWNVDSRWKRVGVLGKALGLEWGGDWTSFKDYPHFQYTFGLSLSKLRAGTKPPTHVKKEVVKVGERDINKVSAWAEKDWKEACKNGYFDGTRPGAPITREEMSIVVNRLRKNLTAK